MGGRGAGGNDAHRHEASGGGALGRYARDFFTNWEDFDAPVTRKVALTLRNRVIAFGLMRGCCGHRGEPGC